MASASLDPTFPPAGRDFGVISLVAFVHGISHFFQLVMPSLFPWLMSDFGLDFTTVGLAMSVFFVISGFGQAAAGFAVDRFGALRVLVFGVACLGVASLLIAISNGLAGLVLAAAVAGCGNAVFHPADFSLLNRRVSERRLGHAFSAHGLSGNIGWALAPLFVVGLATAAGWRTAAVGTALIAFAGVACLLLWRKLLADEPRPTRARGASASTLDFIRVPAVWLCFVFFFCVTLAFGAFQNYGTPLLQALYGLELTAAASGLSAFLFAAAVGVFVGGFLAGRTGNHDRLVAAFLSVAGLVAVALALGVVPSGAAVAGLAAIGFCTGLAGPSRDILVRRAATARFGSSAYGRIYGLVYSGLDAGMALSPLVFGPMMDGALFAAVMGTIAVLQFAAVAAALAAARSVETPAVA